MGESGAITMPKGYLIVLSVFLIELALKVEIIRAEMHQLKSMTRFVGAPRR